MRSRMFFCAVLAAVLIVCQGPRAMGAEENPSLDWLEEKGLTIGESSLSYPAVREGFLAEETRAAVNERILEDGDIRTYATRVSQLVSGGKLRVSWRGEMLGPVFSFAVSAEGAVTSMRSSFVWTGGNIDLRDGHEITLEELFSDPDAARTEMEAYLEEEAAPELSAHLLSSEVSPLPELFRISGRGLVWMYPEEQLSTLHDRAGDLLVPWGQVRELLDLSGDGVLAAMGIADQLAAEEDEDARAESAGRIRAMAEEGALPGIPARLGDSVAALAEEWKLLTDPDVYVLGRFFSLEGSWFQGVFLMTDFLSESWENSVVDGIRTDLGSVDALVIGETTRETWRRMLGEPEHTIAFDEETAEAWRTVPGSRDYYEFGGHRLQLHADEEGVLVSVILSE